MHRLSRLPLRFASGPLFRELAAGDIQASDRDLPADFDDCIHR
jgi:hypothetical protein